jgi:hypothetical protein
MLSLSLEALYFLKQQCATQEPWKSPGFGKGHRFGQGLGKAKAQGSSEQPFITVSSAVASVWKHRSSWTSASVRSLTTW